ncbi:MAG: hypothetical protein K0S42_2554 [Microvirga sp.]|nr:hypothetical protein [Microvirga sp.]
MYSCVVDAKPLYLFQGMVFARTLIELAGVRPEAIVVHLIEGVPASAERALSELGVRTIPVHPFDPRHPYSNKLVQLQTEVLREPDYAVLCDSDLAFVTDIEDWIGGDRLRAKPVDYARPPLTAWRILLKTFGLAQEVTSISATHTGEETYANNFNGGLYIIPQRVLAALRQAWPEWNRRLLQARDRLGPHFVHVDQISLGFALAGLGHIGEPLPLELNLPTHLPLPAHYRPISPPRVLHYHKRIDLAGRLVGTGDALVDIAIDRVNAVIENGDTLGALGVGFALRRDLLILGLRRALTQALKRTPIGRAGTRG